MLYVIALGLAVGLTAGGRFERLARLRFHWAGVAIGALLVQAALFSEPSSAGIGDAGPAIYVASSAAVLLVVLRNIRIVGLPLVALGATANLAAILANGGYMPAAPGALESLGLQVGAGYSNSREFDAAALAQLGDAFAMPAGLPFANVFSVGDVLIGVGVFVAIVWTMRESAPAAGSREEGPGAARDPASGGQVGGILRVVRPGTSPERSVEGVLRDH